MPTWIALETFWRDWEALSPEEQRAFREAIKKFVADLRAEQGFRKGLRVKGVKGAPGVFEMTWADDGRATFEFGRALEGDEPHIIWRRVGRHDIFSKP
jgi:hypothetical protein